MAINFGGLVDTDNGLVSRRICIVSSPATWSTSAAGSPAVGRAALPRWLEPFTGDDRYWMGRAEQARPRTSAFSFKPRKPLLKNGCENLTTGNRKE